ncbi:DNA primase [Oscillatoria amoena NRMC-F 0135]|nr:DNA primase [Geitlerinema splendidum]MDL5048314.1 DNA primase [Oscillatoria amoena NRMC-F 0135]
MNSLKLHPDTIDEIKHRVDIVDIISERVVLRKQGKDLAGLCPFHEEKSPSFTVSPSKQMYYCFGCGAGGNAITFLMELGKQSFTDVVLDLARRYQVPVKTLEPEAREKLQRQLSLREQLYEILALAASFYQHALRQDIGKTALTYLKQTREFSETTIQAFQLGYAPAGWETLYGYLVEQKRYSVQLVEQAGLIVPRQKGSGYYDRFRDRLMIPIHDTQGRIIGFGGRTLTDEQPKYLNSPETELFDKGKTLFGLDKAKDAISKQDRVVVVEGYFDAIALHAAGITNVVASLGTALSSDQIRQLLRYTDSKQVIFNFDADKAGIQATERAIGEVADLAYKGQVQLRILNLPGGKDADEYLRLSGTAAPYQELVENAPLWLDWQIQQIIQGKDLKQAEQYQQAVKAIVKLLCQIVDNMTRTYYAERCANLLSGGDVRLRPTIAKELIAQVKRFQRHKYTNSSEDIAVEVTVPISSEQKLLIEAETLILKAYLHCPEYRSEIINALQQAQLNFEIATHQFLWTQIQAVQEQVDLDSLELLEKLQNHYIQFPEQNSKISHLFYLDEKTKLDIHRTPLAVQASVACMERVMCEKASRYALLRWQKTDRKLDPEGWKYYGEELTRAKQRIAELDKMRHTKFADLVQLPWIG